MMKIISNKCKVYDKNFDDVFYESNINEIFYIQKPKIINYVRCPKLKCLQICMPVCICSCDTEEIYIFLK